MTDKVKKRSGVSVDRAYRIEKKMVSRLEEIISQALICHPTHEQIGEKVYGAVFGMPEAKLVPARTRAYIQGRWDVHRDIILRHHTVWVHSIDGAFYTTEEREALTREEEDLIRIPAVRGAEYLAHPERERREALAKNLCEQVAAGTYKDPLRRIDPDKSCCVARQHT